MTLYSPGMSAEAAARMKFLLNAVVPLVYGKLGTVDLTIASGFLFRRGGKHFLVSATHVLEKLRTEPETFRIPDSPLNPNTAAAPFEPGEVDIAFQPKDAEDVAAVRLDGHAVLERMRAGGWTFLTDEHVLDLDADAEQIGDRYLVFGWPASDVEVLPEKTLGVYPTALDAPKIARPDRIKDPRDTDVFLGWPASLKRELLGISGCPIWAFRLRSESPVWHPTKEVAIVGVEHAVCHGEYIRGTKWSAVSKVIDALL
jgi:hypothetical protein